MDTAQTSISGPERLKRWRVAEGFSAVELARQLECSKSMVNQMERGDARPGRALANQIHWLTGIEPGAWDPQPVAVAVEA